MALGHSLADQRPSTSSALAKRENRELLGRVSYLARTTRLDWVQSLDLAQAYRNVTLPASLAILTQRLAVSSAAA